MDNLNGFRAHPPNAFSGQCCKVSNAAKEVPGAPLPSGLKVFGLAPDQDLKPLVRDAINEALNPAIPLSKEPQQDLKAWFRGALEEHEQTLMFKIEGQLHSLQVVLEQQLGRPGRKSWSSPSPANQDANNNGLSGSGGYTNQNGSGQQQPQQSPQKSQPAPKTPSAQGNNSTGSSSSPGPPQTLSKGASKRNVGASPGQAGEAEGVTNKEFYQARTQMLVGKMVSDKPPQQPKKNLREIFKKWISNTKFDLFWGSLIVANALVMCLNLEYSGGIMAESLGLKNDAAWEGATAAFDAMEHCFNISFAIELWMRVTAFGCSFFKEVANCVDAFIVIINVVDAYILTPLNLGLGVGFDVARLLRIARLVRVLRIVRVMRMFRELRILVRTISSSFGALIWSMVLLFVIQLMCAIFLAQMLQEYIQNEENPREMRLFCFRYYGSATKAMFSMFEVTIGGWVKIARPLVERVNPLFSIFFVTYVAGVSFAVMKIITAIFLRKTLHIANSDAEMVMAERMKAQANYTNQLRAIFDDADDSGDGLINWEEFNEICSDPKVKTLMSMLELDVHEIAGLFNLLDDGDGKISVEEFLSGVTRLKGGAKSLDVMTLITENQKLVRQVKSVAQGIDILLDSNGLPPMEYIPKHCQAPAILPTDEHGEVDIEVVGGS